jgi:5'/3'-nucleotidase
MNFLVTNDDGIDASGLHALEQVAAQLGQCRVVAPRDGHSGCGHLTTTNRPLKVTEHGPNRRAVDGAPADCSRLGLLHFHPDTDWVLSGINKGGNLGADVHLSGTVAAVREAVLLGKPGIAFSHYRRRGAEFNWPRVVPCVMRIARELVSRPWEPGTFYNVNLPSPTEGDDVPNVVECFADPNPLPVRYRFEDGAFHYDGDYHARQRTPGSDIDVCFSGRIAVALIRVG